MTHGRNAPTGWRAFRAFRQVPAPLFVRRHGNWKHGDYAKGSIASRHRLRAAIAVLDGRWSGPLPWLSEPAPGWSVFRSSRSNYDVLLKW
jgi:hypothetical protein